MRFSAQVVGSKFFKYFISDYMQVSMLCLLNLSCSVDKTETLFADWHCDAQLNLLAKQSDGKEKLVMEEEIFWEKSGRYRQFRIDFFTFWAILRRTGMWILFQCPGFMKIAVTYMSFFLYYVYVYIEGYMLHFGSLRFICWFCKLIL